MALEMLIKNIDNLKKWLVDAPNDKDYLRILKKYEEEYDSQKNEQ